LLRKLTGLRFLCENCFVPPLLFAAKPPAAGRFTRASLTRHCSYALQSDASKSSPWLTFIGWVSNGGDAYAPICCRGLEQLSKEQGSMLVSAFDVEDVARRSKTIVLRTIPFYHRCQ
jgi:hypothetical protein